MAAPVSSLLWLVSCSESLSKVGFAFLLLALWSVWKEHNKRVWTHKFTPMESLVALTRSQYHLFFSTQFPASPPRMPRVRQPWQPPPLGWLKAYADGAFDKASNAGGMSVVIRDHCGDVVGGICMQILHVGSPEMVEALASRAACELAINFSSSPIVFEVNSLLVVQATKAIGANTPTLGRIYEDIYACLQELSGSSFSHVYRDSNFEAHKLAKLALGLNLQLSWNGMALLFRSFVSNLCTPQFDR
ncbi:hypothetical protein M0R45_031145 [Rubus argutus]|uniref:RNase H type-1 domain-containing protein n=1 Tax=Rubus argutus TaxID=59490 RepID=A0AAW1WDT4_RUBAR